MKVGSELFQAVDGHQIFSRLVRSQLTTGDGVGSGSKGTSDSGLSKRAQFFRRKFPVGGSRHENLVAEVELENGPIPRFAFKRSGGKSVVQEGRIFDVEQLTHEVIKVGFGNGLSPVAGPLHLLLVVLGAEIRNVGLPFFSSSSSLFQSLGEFGLHETDVPFGEVGLVALLQKVPLDAVLFDNFGSKLRTGGHGIAVGVDNSNFSGELHEFGYGGEPLFGSLALGRQNEESVGKVFDGHQETGGPRVVPGPVLVKLSVVDVVHAGAGNSDGLKFRNAIGSTVMGDRRVSRQVLFDVAGPQVFENFFLSGKRSQLGSR